MYHYFVELSSVYYDDRWYGVFVVIIWPGTNPCFHGFNLMSSIRVCVISVTLFTEGYKQLKAQKIVTTRPKAVFNSQENPLRLNSEVWVNEGSAVSSILLMIILFSGREVAVSLAMAGPDIRNYFRAPRDRNVLGYGVKRPIHPSKDSPPSPDSPDCER